MRYISRDTITYKVSAKIHINDENRKKYSFSSLSSRNMHHTKDIDKVSLLSPYNVIIGETNVSK